MDEIVDWDESTDSWERRHPPLTRELLCAEEEELAAGAAAEAANRAWLEERLCGRQPGPASPLKSLWRELLRHPEKAQFRPPRRLEGI